VTCTTMDSETHRVYAHLTATKRNRRTGTVHISPQNLQRELGFSRWRDFAPHLEDLAEDQAIEWDPEFSRITLLTPCQCEVASSLSPPPPGGTTPRRETVKRSADPSSKLGWSCEASIEDATTRARSRARGNRHFGGGPKVRAEPRSTVELVLYFDRELSKLRGTTQFGRVGETNRQALGGNISRWRQETGATPELIKKMIDVFISTNSGTLRNDVAAWKLFIADRVRLQDLALRALSPGDYDGWRTTPSDPVQSESPSVGYGGWGSTL
jgi:hypothetical protein